MNSLLYPPSIDWELTSVCNHNCIHCYNYWRGLNIEQQELPTEEYLVSVAEKIVDSHPVSVQITGGEPLIVWERAKHAIQILLDNGIRVSMNTNATLVNDEIASFFYKNNMDAFVSFPCNDKDIFDDIVHCKGAAERTEKGINILLSHKVRVSLNMVVTKINFPYIYDTAMYVKQKFGVSYFSATKASFPQNAIQSFRNQMLNNVEFNSMLNTLLQVKKETGMRVDSAWVYSMCGYKDQEVLEQFGFSRKCGCGRYNFVVDSKGNMKACGCDSRTYGNILEDSFENAISRMNEWQDGAFLPEECKQCSNLKYCGGGCRSDAYSTTENRCGMDSTANVANRNRYIHKIQKKVVYSDELTFAINPKTTAIKENCGVRLSIGTNYAYITERFYKYLLTNSCITFGHLKASAVTDEDKLALDISILLRKGILIEVAVNEEAAKDGEGAFSVLVQPYISVESPRMLMDYVCDLNVRYSGKN